MRRDAVAWERAAEVRDAARAWLRAGAIDRATLEAIEHAYPDPCATPSATWRVLTAVIASAVVLCTLAACWVATEPDDAGLALVLLAFAGACAVVTERLRASPRFARRGAAGATAFWTSVFLLSGLAVLVHELPGIGAAQALDAVLLAGVLVWGLGCWRWGHPLFAGLSALSLFVWLGRLPAGRLLWVVAGAVLAGLAVRRCDDAAWAPSHRWAATVLLVTGVAAVYVAVNLHSLEARLVETLWWFAPPHAALPPALRVLAAAATAVLPPAVLTWGWISRRTPLLHTGIALLAVSLVTLSHSVIGAPLWAVLVVSGAALMALALVVERTLRRSPGGERAGFTADPLFSGAGRRSILEAIPVVAALTPAAPPAAREEDIGRGGTFGGGGASGKF